MALDAQEQAFLDFAIAALPRWMNPSDEFLHGCAKMFGSVQTITDYWFGQTVGSAVGPTSTTPDWLGLRAKDRGTARQNGETDPALRNRLKNVPEALTPSSLLAAADAILAAEGIVGSAAMVELPTDGAALGTYVSDNGTGGAFTASTGTHVIFTPTSRFARPPYRDPSVVRKIQSFKLVIAGAAAGGNNGTFPTLGMSGNGVIIDNAAGVLGADAGLTWTVRKCDRRGNIRDGFSKTYATRGYRVSSLRPVIIIILPYGSTVSTEASVREMLRQKKAAGFLTQIERRTSP